MYLCILIFKDFIFDLWHYTSSASNISWFHFMMGIYLCLLPLSLQRHKMRSNDVLEISSSMYSKVISEIWPNFICLQYMCNVDFTIILFFVNSKNQIFRLPVFSIFSSCSILSSITIYVTITQNHRPTSANVKRQKKKIINSL